MKEKIEHLSKGNFEYERPLLSLSTEAISLIVEAGKIHEGNFTIRNHAGTNMNGVVYSSKRQMELLTTSFEESISTIYYRFDAKVLKAENTITGEFQIISDLGEISLPYTVQIEAPYCMSPLGKIKDLFQFTNLARTDWSEAKRIFRSESFAHIFMTNDERNKLIYRSLMNSSSTSQALEEFLIAIHKKTVISIATDKTKVEYNNIMDSLSDKLTITKNGWGYTKITISSEMPFLQLEQKYLWTDQFVENRYQIAYTINPAYLRPGKNYGQIIIKTIHQTLIVDVMCKYKRTEHKSNIRPIRQRVEFGLMDTYLGFRLNRIKLVDYMKDMEALIIRLPGPETSYIRDLMKTHLAIISGKNHLAGEFLSDFSKEVPILKRKSVLEYCIYLYLNALYHKDAATVQNASEAIRSYYQNGYSDWRILWLLLYTDRRYESNKTAKLEDIKDQFALGCKSPILYYEAVCIFNEEPYLLKELDEFEIQALNFGIKNWIISKETAKQYTYLVSKKKAYHPLIFQGLIKLYDEYSSIETLSAICSVLIKGMKRSGKYFEWYRLGVEAQLRITELFEYYMYAASDSDQKVINPQVLLYFVYNNSLNDKLKAMIYANVIQNKTLKTKIDGTYIKQIELFALSQLKSHQISQELAVLYQDLLYKSALSTDMMYHLPYVLYRYELICSNLNIVHVIVIHKELTAEESYPLTNGKAQINLYTSNAEIVLLDSQGNRYLKSIDFNITPLFHSEEYEEKCVPYSNHPMLLLHLFDHYHNYRILNNKAIDLRKKVLLLEGLTTVYETNCLQTLIDYYYENYNDDQLEFYLNQIDLNKVYSQERNKYIEYMLIRTFYHKALEALNTFGYEGIAINRLVKLCSGWLKTATGEIKQDEMINLCYYVFSQDKYDEAMLKYLISYYNGSTETMLELWQAAKGFELNAQMLEERILTQILYTGCNIRESGEIFHSYYSDATNRTLIRAYLSYSAYRYLIWEDKMEDELLQIMKRELFYEDNNIYLLAWLKYHGGNKALSENEKIFAEFGIQKMVKKNIIFPFFLKYQENISLPERLIDKYIISYFTDPKKHVFIHFRTNGDEKNEFVTERMNHSFLGIHIKEFMLFHHEELDYYITEESEDENKQTDLLQVRYECTDRKEDESNYSLINQMIMSYEKQDDNVLLQLMEEYAKKEYMISECFQPIHTSFDT